ncbi:MAG: VOC family protein [Pseudomonadota bacterium]
MEFRFSRNTALQTKDPNAARHFYGDVLGMGIKEYPEGPQIQAGAIDIFIDHGEIGDTSLLLELNVDDLNAARVHLEQNGCSVLRWEGIGRACIVKDPFGLVFNVWQDP